MIPLSAGKCRYFIISLLFLVIFYSIALIYTNRTSHQDLKQFETHAVIIANDVWALNEAGVQAYLQLAVNANHYKSLGVAIPGDEEFHKTTSPPLSGLAEVLFRMGLIGIKDLSTAIKHEDQNIGTLYGQQYVRVIFPLFNILIFLLFVLLTTVFVTHLFLNRRYLEQQVEERTQNLRESERRFHDLVDLLPEMVLETNLHGRILYANKAAKDQLGIAFQSASAAFADFIDAEDRERFNQAFRDSLERPQALQEFTVRDREDHTFPVLLRAAPIMKGDDTTGARMIIVDITERHRLEEQLRRDQKMKAIGLMAGGVAHDLNNILSGIISYPELLLLDLEEGNRLRRPLESIRQAGLDASEVVSDLLTVARGIAANREVTNPNKMVEDYLASPDFLQTRSRFPLITFHTFLDPNLSNISCSPIHIRKCLMNLITNGVEAIQGKGTVTIATANHFQSEAAPYNSQILPEGNYVMITVGDSGSGIAPHEIAHIFEPFFTKKVMGRSGTGLGLAVVWNTMRDHGGVVSVASDKHGTTFKLFFPAVADRMVEMAVKDLHALKGNREKVLVIDDEARQREIASKLLASLNYCVATVPSGERAVEYLQSHSADILVLDMIMDPGQNGRATYKQILKIHPGQRAVIASGFAENSEVRKTLEMGAGAFVSKPYTLEQIGSAIYKTLHS